MRPYSLSSVRIVHGKPVSATETLIGGRFLHRENIALVARVIAAKRKLEQWDAA